jgi:hypothetical protein
MTDSLHRPVKIRIWLWWVLASAAGSGFGFIAANVIHGAPREAVYEPPFEVLVFGLIGTGLGITQWLVLRHHVANAGWWVGVTALWGALVGTIAVMLGSTPAIGIALGYGLAGCILGGLQWLVLRRHFAQALRWVAASAIAWALSVPVTAYLDQSKLWKALAIPEAMGLAVLYGVAGAVVGVVTGGLLVWLLRGPRSAQLNTGERMAGLASRRKSRAPASKDHKNDAETQRDHFNRYIEV